MTQDLDALPLPVPTHFRNGVLYAFSADQIRAARREGYELAKREAQEGREQTTAQGKINAELDTDSNTSESQQRRHMAGSLEMGQLVGDRQDSRSGDIEPQGAQHVATLRGIDEYGPMLDWHKHWVDLPIGAKLLVAHAAQQPQGQAVSDEEIMQMSDAAGITFDDCGEHPPAVREDCCLKSRVTEFARAILSLRPDHFPGATKMMPLSDEQISEISVECALKSPSDIVFARAIEAAHGITAKEQGRG